MSDVLTRAKLIQQKASAETTVWIKLDLLEGLIAEIEALQHRVEVLSAEHPAHKLRPVREAAEAREK